MSSDEATGVPHSPRPSTSVPTGPTPENPFDAEVAHVSTDAQSHPNPSNIGGTSSHNPSSSNYQLMQMPDQSVTSASHLVAQRGDLIGSTHLDHESIHRGI